MSLFNVRAGSKAPEEVNVVIEIPARSDPIKYEVDKETGALFVDRFLGTSMHYPCNYGYVPGTIAGDGDPVDVLVVTPFPLLPGVVVRSRPIGMLKMQDESGEDAKVIAVPVSKTTTWYDHIQTIDDSAPVSLSTSYLIGSERAGTLDHDIDFFRRFAARANIEQTHCGLSVGWSFLRKKAREIAFYHPRRTSTRGTGSRMPLRCIRRESPMRCDRFATALR